jgi:hypothetical protein
MESSSLARRFWDLKVGALGADGDPHADARREAQMIETLSELLEATSRAA